MGFPKETDASMGAQVTALRCFPEGLLEASETLCPSHTLGILLGASPGLAQSGHRAAARSFLLLEMVGLGEGT